MTLSEMRRALETTVEENNENPEDDVNQRPKARLPPDSRGVKESRSLLVKVDLSEHAGGQQRKGTLTFANSVSELRRAGSSREEVGGSPSKPLRRAPPQRAQSCAHAFPLPTLPIETLDG